MSKLGQITSFSSYQAKWTFEQSRTCLSTMYVIELADGRLISKSNTAGTNATSLKALVQVMGLGHAETRLKALTKRLPQQMEGARIVQLTLSDLLEWSDYQIRYQASIIKQLAY
jgi:hypothetical protein